MRPCVSRVLFALILALVLLPYAVSVQSPRAGGPTALAGLTAAAQITRDTKDVPHVSATNDHDVYFLQGYVHAQDRLFQMDYSRRQASGTLAELLGPAALSADVQMRTFGLRRAAEASLPVLSPETQAALSAYTDGVNAYVAAHPALPPEYGVVGVTTFEPWTPTDSVAIGKLIAFGLSFDLSDIDNTVALLSYQQAGAMTGFDGTRLFFEDLFRSAPFSSASTIPDASVASMATSSASLALTAPPPDAARADLARGYLEKVKNIPAVQRYIRHENRPNSNEWAIAPSHTTSGQAIVANDPHLALGTPAVWYPIHLSAGTLDVIGNSFPGVPSVVLGHNRHAGWGATVNPLDVTDVFQEQIVVDTSSPSGYSIVHAGTNEPIIPIPEVFKANIGGTVQVVPPGNGIPAATLIVPRRNNGPIIQMGNGTALSVAFTGFGPTRELDTFRMFDESNSLAEFQAGLAFFDFGSQNFAYADVDGNIAYFTSAEMPIRTDLQSGTVVGLPPYFIRNGTISANDWMPVVHPQPNQALSFEILPADEMPHIVNPPAGWFVNCNNDPVGTTLDNNPLNQLRPGGGIYYLSPGYDGFRAGRVTERLRQMLTNGPVSFDDMQAVQADTVMIDAEVFVPYITEALARAQASATPALKAFALSPQVNEAVGRLGAWNFSTPTGIPQGFDAVHSTSDAANSVAATIYALWRSQFVANVIDSKLTPYGLPVPGGSEALAGLRTLLENFATGHGVGASGVPFFFVPNVTDPADARDILILKSVADALTLLAGDAFKPAFDDSTNQDDYRWGLLHRIVFAHPLDSVFNIPPAGGAVPQPLADPLSGFPTDGGFETVDVASHDVRAASWNHFMFSHGPSNRSVHEGASWGMHGVSSLPGGVSGVVGSPYYANLLTAWLQNVAYTEWQRQNEITQNTMSVRKFVPGK
jgi:penicillin amidase